MPFDQQNSDYEKQYYSIFRKELVADRDNKILKKMKPKKGHIIERYIFLFSQLFSFF